MFFEADLALHGFPRVVVDSAPRMARFVNMRCARGASRFSLLDIAHVFSAATAMPACPASRVHQKGAA
jgi:hypothetical protein